MNKLPINQIIHGNSLEVMKTFPDDSIDLIVTDPPYQLSSITRARPDQTDTGSYGKEMPHSRVQSRIKGFMGKEWDVLPRLEIWKECLRVLKAGAFAFIMMTPRQDSHYRCLRDLEKAGFMISFSPIFWTYASGFPKASNISKMVDKRFGVEREVIGKKSCGYQVSISKKRKEEGYRPNLTNATIEVDITIPTIPQAKELDGSYGGFQPKPAVEIIIVAMKPLSEKTFVDQALINKKGITWLDDCRIPYESEDDKTESSVRFRKQQYEDSFGYRATGENNKIANQQGRFPANLLVCDDVLDDGKITKGFNRPNLVGKNYDNKFVEHSFNKVTFNEKGMYIDSGSFSRYFDLDMWFSQRIKRLPKEIQRTFPFMIVPKASKSEKNKGIDRLKKKRGGSMKANVTDKMQLGGASLKGNHKEIQQTKNVHPTVKPLKLMSYLITLGSRKGDVILDPFIGSGTTAVACRLINRNFIGIEIESEYIDIAKARISTIPKSLKVFIS